MSNKFLQIHFERRAEKFFDKKDIGRNEVSELIIKAIKKLSGHNENVDVKHLKGELKGYLRIRKNNLRIIFKVIEDESLIIATVVNIDFRGNVYK